MYRLHILIRKKDGNVTKVIENFDLSGKRHKKGPDLCIGAFFGISNNKIV